MSPGRSKDPPDRAEFSLNVADASQAAGYHFLSLAGSARNLLRST